MKIDVNLEKLIEEIEIPNPSKSTIEHIDNEFTYMFDIGVKHAAGPLRIIKQ